MLPVYARRSATLSVASWSAYERSGERMPIHTTPVTIMTVPTTANDAQCAARR